MTPLVAGCIQAAYSSSFEVETLSLWGIDQITLIIRIEWKVSLSYTAARTLLLCDLCVSLQREATKKECSLL